MVETAELSEKEYREEITALAKEGIRNACVRDDGTVDMSDDAHKRAVYAGLEGGDDKITEFASEYPLSVVEYTITDEWWPDAHDVTGRAPSEAVTQIVHRLVWNDVASRARELLDGEWDAIQTKTESRTITEERTVFDG